MKCLASISLILLIGISSGLILDYSASAQDVAAPEVTISFNPTGTHIKDGQLKVRFDIYYGEGSKSFASNYVDILDENGKPTGEKQLTPTLCHFISISKDTTEVQLTNCIFSIFDTDTIKSIDEASMLENSAHAYSAIMEPRTYLTKAKIYPSSPSLLISTINNRFSELYYITDLSVTNIQIITKSIDVGPGAFDAESISGGGFTIFDTDNPANADGTIDTVQIYGGSVNTDAGTKVGTGYGSALPDITCRDAEVIGVVASGGLRTFTGLTIDIIAGDLIGRFYTDGTTEADHTGAEGGRYYYLGDALTATVEQTYTNQATRAVSLYGTGTEGGAPPPITPTSGGGVPLAPSIAMPTSMQLLVILLILASFSALAFWKENAVLFMLAAGASMVTGLSWFDVYDINVGMGLSLMFIAYSLLCLGLSFRCIFWREDVME